MEEELQQLLVGQICRSIGADQEVFHRRLADFFVVDALTIVFNFYINVVAAMVGADGNVSMVAFSGLIAELFLFDSMGDCVADQMDQRVGDLLNNVVVQFGLSPGESKLDLLVGGLGR